MSDEKVPPPDPSPEPAPPPEGSLTLPTEPSALAADGMSPGPTAEVRVQPVPGPAASPEPAPASPPPAKAGLLGQPPAPASPAPGQGKPHDVFREVAETVVFVVVLVLLLKTFIAEAFVIPTGSMATTLWGYQKVATCPECAFQFPVNCSSQVEPPHASVLHCECPNCRYRIQFPTPHDPPCNSGDRVLVGKFLYESGLFTPQRHDVVVFKFPGKPGSYDYPGPQKNHAAINYIKRLIGKSGETIGIHAGKLDVAEDIAYGDLPGVRPEDLRLPEAMFINKPEVVEQLRADVTRADDDPRRKFKIIRKRPEVLLALSRPVYDNDFQAADLAVLGFPRWQADQGGWKPDAPMFPKVFTTAPAGQAIHWLRYHHWLRDKIQSTPPGKKPEAQLITDFMGYNSGKGASANGRHWVGDLMIETHVKLDRAAAGDELLLELSKGIDRFQARFSLDTGLCTLVRITKDQEAVLGKNPTPLKGSGTFQLRFANVDNRLTLWVNQELPFGDGQAYNPAAVQGPDPEPDPLKNNDLQPASIGIRGTPALSVSHLKLNRDTYYTTYDGSSNLDYDISLSDPRDWKNLRMPYKTMYVQPRHYLCMGDNSPESSDGRDWGLVPDRLLLGRALLVYFPFKFGPIGAENRIGLIE